MVIGRAHVDEMIQHARADFPNEACGILATKGGEVVELYRLRNAAESPVQYLMDSRDQLRVMLDIDDHEWDLGAIYHSHTRTRAYPSQTDIGLAQYPGALHIIVSLADERRPEVRAFRIENGAVHEEALEVVPR